MKSKRFLVYSLSSLTLVLLLSLADFCNAFPHKDKNIPLPKDPAVVSGVLSNGVHYLIEPSPQQHGAVSLWLNIAVGSADEKKDEQGMAHFLEHMAFEGTTHFDAADIERTFTAMGMGIGVHRDAHTTFNQTTYTLNLASADTTKITTLLHYLSEVSSQMTLQPDKIESEKKIVVQEIRARNDMQQRLLRQLFGIWFRDTPAGDHAILGPEDSVKSYTREALEQFYKRNYRPENTTIIVTGDVDPNQVKAVIEQAFSGNTPEPDSTVTANFKIQKPVTAITKIVTDPETRDAEVMVSAVTPPVPVTTIDAFRQSLVRKLATDILQHRLDSMRQHGDQSFYSDQAMSTDMFQVCHLDGVSLTAEAKNWKQVVSTAATEFSRVWQHGFGSGELEEAKKSILNGAQQDADGTASLSARQLAENLVENVSIGSENLSPAQVLTLTKSMLANITPQDLDQQFHKDFSPDSRVITLVVPPSNAADAPNAEMVSEAFVKAGQTDLPPWKVEKLAAGFLPKDPAPAQVPPFKQEDGTEINSVLLPNNIVVHQRQMDVVGNQVMIQVTIAGGELEEDATNRGVTRAVVAALNEPATTSLSSSEIQRLLVDKSVRLAVRPEPDCVSLLVTAEPNHIEDAFRLLNALLTSMHIQQTQVDSWKKAAKEKSAEQDANAIVAGLWEMNRFLYSDDLRWHPLTNDEIDHINLADMGAWSDHLLQHAPLEVAVVGPLSADRTSELTAKYLASLPQRDSVTDGKYASLRKIQNTPGPVTASPDVKSVANESVVTLAYRGAAAHMMKDSAALRLTEVILTQRLKEKLRVETGLTYSIQVTSQPGDAYPDVGVFLIRFTCDPKTAQQAAKVCLDAVAELAKNGPTVAELADAKIQVANETEEERNMPNYWLSKMARLLYTASNNDDVLKFNNLLAAYTQPEDLRAVIDRYLVPGRQVLVVSGPRSNSAS